ncbi:MAG: hypothetical protein GY765_09110 [bacterium]|nr:hypothetical protein [bacterium]
MTTKHVKQKRGPVRLLLTLLALVGLAMLVVPFILVPPASLDIRLEDTAFDTPLGGKTAVVTDENGYSREVPIYKYAEGYIAHIGRVKSGESKWMVEVENYQSVHFQTKIKPLDKKRVTAKLTPTFGRLKITAMNAVKPDVQVHTQLTATIDGKKFSGEAGEILTVSPVVPGKHKITFEAPDYFSYSQSVNVPVGEEKEVIVYLAPGLRGDEIARIVLRWGRDPRDLDAHILLPKGADNKHVYYPSKKKKASVGGRLAVMLDVDDTTSYGPETVTVMNKLDGRYTFGVYHYTGSGSLGSSEAVVEVYLRGGDVRRFTVPEYCQKRWWHVFDFEVAGSEVQVLSKNECLDKMNMMPGKK